SFGTAGCNLTCKFCQNWDISKARALDRLQQQASPQANNLISSGKGSCGQSNSAHWRCPKNRTWLGGIRICFPPSNRTRNGLLFLAIGLLSGRARLRKAQDSPPQSARRPVSNYRCFGT